MDLKQYKEKIIEFVGSLINDYSLCMSGADSAVFTYRNTVSSDINDMLVVKYNDIDETYDITLSYDVNGNQIDWSSPIFTERSLKYVLQELEDVMTYWEHDLSKCGVI